MIPIDLTGKVALITGAGEGLGRATATMLHRAGATVIVNYFNDPSGSNRDKAEDVVRNLGQRAITSPADVRDPAQVRAMMAEAKSRFGGIDILVNNAGILRDRTIKKMTEDEWQSVIDTNLTGVFHTMQAGLEVMRDGGRVVNISSIASSIGFFGQSNYAAAKAGVAAMARVAAREVGKRRITVNAIAPGVVLTNMGKSIPEDARAQMLVNIPLGRFGEPDEIAGVILFLCSDLASYVNGHTVHINGGWFG
ncbi:MAG: 3-oxoacyl-ACP reductase FabG [Phycisphaeraceae bacterium]|nr:3-oxoacyl-ACP reductase FabG [Phycisphaeraceae bacterium]